MRFRAVATAGPARERRPPLARPDACLAPLCRLVVTIAESIYHRSTMFDFSAFHTLMTDRLILRECQVDDAADLFAFRSDPEGQKFNSQPMKDRDESVTLIDEIRQAYATQCAVHWAVALAETGRVMALFDFGAWERYHRRAEVGYDLAADNWGRGLATEALAAILSFGFQEMQLNRVEAQTIVDNLPSVRLLLRLGFRQEGVRREYRDPIIV